MRKYAHKLAILPQKMFQFHVTLELLTHCKENGRAIQPEQLLLFLHLQKRCFI